MHCFSGEAAETREVKSTMGMQEGTIENRIALCKLLERGIGKGFFFKLGIWKKINSEEGG